MDKNFLIVTSAAAVYCYNQLFIKDASFTALRFYHDEFSALRKAEYLQKYYASTCAVLPISDQLKRQLFATKNLTALIQSAIFTNDLFSKKILNTLAKSANVQVLNE